MGKTLLKGNSWDSLSGRSHEFQVLGMLRLCVRILGNTVGIT